MAIAKNPKRNTERKAEEFISAAGVSAPGVSTPGLSAPGLSTVTDTATEESENKKPIMVRIDPNILKRIDSAAKRLGISRSAFIVSSTAEKLERMEQST
jgi:Ribbon-helix-helix protein, copG family